MRVLKALLMLCCMACIVSPLQGQADSESKTLDRIAREQQNIHQRLEHLLNKMDRLTKKSELEGKEHTADLIRRAQAEIKNREILKRIEDLDSKIRASQLTVDEEQNDVLKDLEDIFAILQDRSDLERLEDMIRAYRDGVEKLEQLIDAQDSLLQETRRLVYDKETLAASAREKLDQILKDQKDLNARVEKAGSRSSLEEDLLNLARSLDSLAEMEEERDRTAAEPDGEGGEATSSAQRLEEKMEELKDQIQNLEEKAAQGGDGPAPVKEALRQAKEAAAQAGERSGEEQKDPSGENREGDAGKESKPTGPMREAAQKMREAGEEEFRKDRKESFEFAGRQDLLRKEMEELEDTLSKLESLVEKKENQEARGTEQSKAIQQEMETARNQLQQGDHPSAKQSQEQAVEMMEQLARQLKEEQASPSEDENQNASHEERAREFKELAERQKDLEEQVRDLMRRLRELPDRKPVQNMSDSADNMAGAAEELSREKGQEAETDEAEAKKYLEKALQKMAQEENKYQNIRQQEVLFRVQQALEDLKKDQDQVNTDTLDFDIALGPDRRLNRLQRKAIKTLAQREEEVKEKCVEIRKKIEEDDATVFSWVLERNEEDLDEVIGSLKRRESGPLVQSMQQDISGRFGELIEALKLELQRRMQALAEQDQSGGPPPGQSGPEQKNPLIPPVAELLMIKKMEENTMRRINEFARLHPRMVEEDAGLVAEQMLKRLGHQHSSITELFEKMLKRIGFNGGAPPAPSGQ